MKFSVPDLVAFCLVGGIVAGTSDNRDMARLVIILFLFAFSFGDYRGKGKS